MSHALRIERQKAGLSLTDLSARIHIHKSILSRIENEERQLRAADLPRFAEALGCTITALLTPTPEAMSIGGCLRNARLAHSLTQNDIATYLKVSPSAIDRWERGMVSIPSPKLAQLTALLALEPDAGHTNTCPCLTLVGATDEGDNHA